MIRTFLTLSIFAGTALPSEPIRPTLITLNDETNPRGVDGIFPTLAKQAGISIDFAPNLNGYPRLRPLTVKNEPFWTLLERLADNLKAQIDVGPNGAITLIPLEKSARQPSCVSGAFRIVAKSIALRKNFGTAGNRNDLMLEFQWEPRFPVFRFDASKAVVKASDDRGTALTAILDQSKTAVGETCIHTKTIEIQGLTREAKKIAKLEGSITVTASPKMLAFTFDDLTAKLPMEKELDGVKVTLAKFAPAEGRWDAEFKLLYPDGHPDFESFETWLDNNKLRLLSADRTKSFAPDNFSTSVNGRRATAEYHFLAAAGKGPQLTDRKGWSLVYETPAPLVEFSVPFTLTDIELP